MLCNEALGRERGTLAQCEGLLKYEQRGRVRSAPPGKDPRMATWASWGVSCRFFWVSSSSWAPFSIQAARSQCFGTRPWHDIDLMGERVKGNMGGRKYLLELCGVGILSARVAAKAAASSLAAASRPLLHQEARPIERASGGRLQSNSLRG